MNDEPPYGAASNHLAAPLLCQLGYCHSVTSK
jgi:hypothetical protein